MVVVIIFRVSTFSMVCFVFFQNIIPDHVKRLAMYEFVSCKSVHFCGQNFSTCIMYFSWMDVFYYFLINYHREIWTKKTNYQSIIHVVFAVLDKSLCGYSVLFHLIKENISSASVFVISLWYSAILESFP